MRTSEAFLFSMRPTTWLRPYLTVQGFLLTSSFFLPSLTAVASLRRRSFFSGLVSGRYLLRSLKAWAAVFLSRTCWNCARAGGTFKRIWRIFFWRWRRTYSGHFTMRETLRLGWMSWPIPKLRGRFSIKGFLGPFLLPALPWGNGAAATFLPDLGGILSVGDMLRREEQDRGGCGSPC